jgi:hypothetical protein
MLLCSVYPRRVSSTTSSPIKTTCSALPVVHHMKGEGFRQRHQVFPDNTSSLSPPTPRMELEHWRRGTFFLLTAEKRLIIKTRRKGSPLTQFAPYVANLWRIAPAASSTWRSTLPLMPMPDCIGAWYSPGDAKEDIKLLEKCPSHVSKLSNAKPLSSSIEKPRRSRKLDITFLEGDQSINGTQLDMRSFPTPWIFDQFFELTKLSYRQKSHENLNFLASVQRPCWWRSSTIPAHLLSSWLSLQKEGKFWLTV